MLLKHYICKLKIYNMMNLIVIILGTHLIFVFVYLNNQRGVYYLEVCWQLLITERHCCCFNNIHTKINANIETFDII